MRRTSLLAATGALLLSAAPVAAAQPQVRIHDIQGTTRVSPLAGKHVADVPGVVTGVRASGASRGFWFQDPNPDNDPRTSEGLFVYTGDKDPAVAVGDAVTVSGVVSEYYPLSSGETPETTANQSVTELTGASWQVTGKGSVPAEEIGPDTVPQAYAAQDGNIEKTQLDPARYALDYFESREGMVLRVDDARVVGPTDTHRSLWVTTKPDQNRNPRGGTTYTGYADANSGRLKVESLARGEFPAADVGDSLRGGTEGPLDYSSYGGYVLEANALGQHVPGGLKPESTRKQADGELSVATYNVENLAPSNDPAKFQRLADGVVRGLSAPDIVAVEEVQDNSGPEDDGVVDASQTLTKLTDAIAAAGGPHYQWRQIDPQNNADGGQPGGNIRVAFLFNPDRVSFVDKPGGDATTPVHPVADGGRAALSASPGRIAPTDDAWKDSRKPLVGQFEFRGAPVFVVADHFASKGGDQPMHGRFQPPTRSSEEQRTAQSRLVRGFVDDLRRVDGGARAVVLGDLNDFGFSPALAPLTDGGALTDLATTLPPAERYSYVYEGNSQQLDHTLVTPGVRADYDIVHLNAEFHDQTSDHDPQVTRIQP